MAREYARIRISIAGDDDVEDLTPMAQWLYFRVLIADSTLSHCGVADWRPQRLLGKARGLTLATILDAAAELERARFVLFSPDTEEVLVRSYVRTEELLRNPKFAVAVRDAYLAIASRSLRAAVVSEIRRERDEHPEYSSWTHAISRDAVEYLLGAKGSDQVPHPVAFGIQNGNQIGHAEPVQNGNRNGNAQRVAKTNPDPGEDYQPDAHPHSLHLEPNSLEPAPDGGYESPVGHQAEPPAEDPTTPPPRFCSKHPEGTSDPCHDCRKQRQIHDRWQTAKAAAIASDARDARVQAFADRAMAIVDCPLCDDDGYRAGVVCSHREHASAETRAAARAAVAAAMAKGGDQ